MAVGYSGRLYCKWTEGTDMLIELLKKYKAPILYVFFGGVTTVINIGVYWLLHDIAGMSNDISNIISWIITVTVAYVTNKLWVFESGAHTIGAVAKEVAGFFSCRIATGVIDFAIMHIGVDIMGFNGIILKTLSNIIVIILNYVASKLFIFKKADAGEENDG